jgi:hypothetical protein
MLITGVADPHRFQCEYGSSFYFNANADPDPGRQTYADRCGSESWSNFALTKS